MAGTTSAAMVSGNTVLLKPASNTPVIAHKFIEVLEEAGMPKGVVNYIPGSGSEVGDYLVDHPRTRFVSFTGSREVGTRIFERAAKIQEGQIWLKRTILEMGGKDTIVVDKEADLELAAQSIVQSAFGFSGQKCSACSRAVILEDVYDEVEKRVVELTKEITVGDPATGEHFMGPVIDQAAYDKILSYVEIGKEEGNLLVGGDGDDSTGWFVNPTVFGEVDPEARIMQEEIFGPVVALTKAKDFDEEKRQGIGTFAPSVNNDMTELYGDVDARRIEELGDASDARSFSFSGELHKANRGIMEFIEILKAEDDLLHVLLSLAEEEEFKMPRFPLVSVDETLIAHTNEEEFLKFISKKENEAIVDRLFIVAMPYNMDPRDEELIYHSAVQDIIKGTGKTIHPGAIRFASEYVIFTRMPDYNEEDEFGDFLEMREGMFGLSPRFILNTIGLAITRELDDDILTPDDMFESLERMIKEYRVLTDETRSMYLKILEELYKRKRDAYFDMTINDVDRRFLDDFGLGGRRITG